MRGGGGSTGRGCSARAGRLTSAIALVLALVHAAPAGAQGAPAATFPASWAGTWRGTLEIYDGPVLRRRVPAERTISATPEPDGYVWRTVYDNDPRTTKDYRVRVVDAATGRYALDERNGIVIEARLLGDALVNTYNVGRMGFYVHESLRGDTLTMDLLFWDLSKPSETKGRGPNGEGGTPVIAYPMSGRQRLVLTRVR